MANDPKEKKFVYDAFDLIRFTWEKKWILIGISLLAFILSIIVAVGIKPRYKSAVIMFPAASVSISKNLVELQVSSSDTKDLLTFGEEEEAERLLQILNSDLVRQYIIDKYNLMHHYRIDSLSSKFPNTSLIGKYKGNVKFRRTEYSSIEISVMDEDPQMAAEIANTISTYVDSVFFKIKYSRAKDALTIVESEYLSSEKTIKTLSDSLNIIRSFGIQEYYSQAEAINTGYAEAVLMGDEHAIRKFEEKMKILSKYGAKYVELTEILTREIGRLTLLKAKLSAAKVNFENTMSNVFIVDKARVAEKKTTPKRSIIVFMSTLSTFAIALLLLVIIENYKIHASKS